MTLLGLLPLLFFKDINQRKQDILLGMSGGIMLAATTFSLLLPSLEESKHTFGFSPFWTVTIVSVSILIGIGFIKVVSRYFDFEQCFNTQENISSAFILMMYLDVTLG